MFGICVGFQRCDAAPSAGSEVLAQITRIGPDLTLQLTSDGQRLSFRVTDPNHPLAQRAMRSIALPDGTRPELLPFVRRNVTNYVDL